MPTAVWSDPPYFLIAATGEKVRVRTFNCASSHAGCEMYRRSSLEVITVSVVELCPILVSLLWYSCAESPRALAHFLSAAALALASSGLSWRQPPTSLVGVSLRVRKLKSPHVIATELEPRLLQSEMVSPTRTKTRSSSAAEKRC